MKRKLIAYLLTQLATPEPVAPPLPRRKRGSIAVYMMGELIGYVG